MKKVKIYSTRYCSYCKAAKSLLKKMNITFEEIDLTGNYQELENLRSKTTWQTVPQIFIEDKFIGGYKELLSISKKKDSL